MVIRIRVPQVHRPHFDPAAPPDAICLCRAGVAVQPLGHWSWDVAALLSVLAELAETLGDRDATDVARRAAEAHLTRAGRGVVGTP